MRVLVATTPGTGHVHPVLPLARALADRGHQIVWVTGASGAATVARHGFRSEAAGVDVGERIATVAQRFPDLTALPPRERRPMAFAAHFAAVAAPAMVDALDEAMRRHRPDVVVHEAAELASAPLARRHGIPAVTVAFSGALSETVVREAAAVVAPIWERAGLTPSDDLGLHDGPYLHPFPPSFGQRPAHPGVRDVRGDAADLSVDEERPPWSRSLGSARPAVYVTFGTEMGPLAPWDALRAAIDGLDLEFVVTVGGMDARSTGPWPASTRVERYVPQRFLLDRVAAVVSHGGAGTALAAAAAGLPQVLVPLGADQWENADAVAGAGAGRVLETGERDADALRQALEAVLSDASTATAARSVAAQISAMTGPATVVAEIEQLGT